MEFDLADSLAKVNMEATNLAKGMFRVGRIVSCSWPDSDTRRSLRQEVGM